MTSRKKILVIDDEKDVVEMIRDFLMSRGYDVVTAYDGEEGLEKLAKETPDLIILDMNMPKMGGIAFYQRVYDPIDDRPKYPVLVLTARANLEQLFRDLNVDGFMNKPFEIDKLLTEIEIILTKRSHLVQRPAAAERRQHRVLIVEDEIDTMNNLTVAFANAGYAVSAIKTGAATFDGVVRDVPDVILIKLGLKDIPGDILAYKLRQISRTSEIPIILFTVSGGMDDESRIVLTKICEKAKVQAFVETHDAYALLKTVNDLLGNNPGVQ